MPVQNIKIDDAITTTKNKPDEFIFCFNRQRFLLLSIQCGNFISWVDIILVAGYCGPHTHTQKKKKNMADWASTLTFGPKAIIKLLQQILRPEAWFTTNWLNLSMCIRYNKDRRRCRNVFTR